MNLLGQATRTVARRIVSVAEEDEESTAKSRHVVPRLIRNEIALRNSGPKSDIMKTTIGDA